jgi:dTDP-4-amino-4,6-dideoxygalactose transaminase
VDSAPDDLLPPVAAFREALLPGECVALWEHVCGCLPPQPQAVRALAEVAAGLVEDAGGALGATSGELAVGELGTAAVFSLDADALLTAGQGALLAGAPGPGRSPGAWDQLGELHAALGLSQLKNLSYCLEKRRMLGRQYLRALRGLPGLEVPRAFAEERVSWQCMVVLVPDAALAAARLSERGVEAAPAARCLAPDTCPHAARLAARALRLPLYPELREAEVARVVATLREVLG